MNKRIALPVFLVPFLVIGLTFAVSCKATSSTPSPQYPKMTAPEVCQYINQALPISYESIPGHTIVFRYEVQYTALNASYQTSDSRWLVNVEVVKKPQRLLDNKWADTYVLNLQTISSTQQYYFSETTGALIKR